MPLFLTAVVSLLMAWGISKAISSPLVSFLTIAVVCSSFVFFVAYNFIFDQNVRDQVKAFVKSKIGKKKK